MLCVQPIDFFTLADTFLVDKHSKVDDNTTMMKVDLTKLNRPVAIRPDKHPMNLDLIGMARVVAKHHGFTTSALIKDIIRDEIKSRYNEIPDSVKRKLSA